MLFKRLNSERMSRFAGYLLLTVLPLGCTMETGDEVNGMDDNDAIRADTEIEASFSLQGEYDWKYSGGLFGRSKDFPKGDWCTEGHVRSHYDSWSDGQGWCAVKRWYSEDERDCRVFVHVGVGAFRSGKCHVRVYEK